MKMFKSLGNLASMMKQAQQMGGKLDEVNQKLSAERVKGESGAGLVSVEMNGLGEVLQVSIAPELFEKQDGELMEDLVRAAVNTTREKTKEVHARVTQEMAAGMNIPGLEQALEQFGKQPD
ncbi:MAG: YbaB/EbfC family nucleoid-associated protein [Rhodopirellula sp.]|nr:YbaB/EbfC family nucleoid-associated protein [Rhodopirellula sp.]|tara:strand:- start:593 stop:955 length:363 start_codon:yes stop_codon:yes gene_type:complete